MLAYLLALAVGLASLGLYLTAFLFEELHRKYDLLWSGIGMFYALVLWVCAGRITGGLLLGQMAGVALLGWCGWQMMEMRWQQVPVAVRSQFPHSPESLNAFLRELAQQLLVNVQHNQWRSSSLTQINRLAESTMRGGIALWDWAAAFVGTTVKSWEKAVPPGEQAPGEQRDDSQKESAKRKTQP